MLYGPRKPRADTAMHPMPMAARLREPGHRPPQQIEQTKRALRRRICARELAYATDVILGPARLALLGGEEVLGQLVVLSADQGAGASPPGEVRARAYELRHGWEQACLLRWRGHFYHVVQRLAELGWVHGDSWRSLRRKGAPRVQLWDPAYDPPPARVTHPHPLLAGASSSDAGFEAAELDPVRAYDWGGAAWPNMTCGTWDLPVGDVRWREPAKVLMHVGERSSWGEMGTSRTQMADVTPDLPGAS